MTKIVPFNNYLSSDVYRGHAPPRALKHLTLSILDRLQVYLSKPVDSTGLALFRIAYGLTLLGEFGHLYYFRHFVFDHIPYSVPYELNFGPALPAPGIGEAEPEADPCAMAQRRSWAELLQRTFAVDVLRCPTCGGRRHRVATLTDPLVARRVLHHSISSPGPPR